MPPTRPLPLRRRGLLAASTLALGIAALAPAQAQQPAPAPAAGGWPARPIRLVVPFPPGGPTDTASRIVGQKLAERLGQPVLVDNRAGASGSIAAAQVAKAPPDGYTLMMLATPTLLAPLLYKSVGFSPQKDLAPVATVYELPIVIVVNPTRLPQVTSLPQLIAYARAQATPMSYTSSGIGSFGHLSMELLKQQAGFQMQHVPYKGSVPAITDTIGGQVPVMYSDLIAALPHMQAGKLRAIAVGSPERVAAAPEVKTIAEQGFKGYSAVSWGGLMAPQGMPAAVVQRVAQEVRQILADPDVQARMLGAGAIARFEDAPGMQRRIDADYAKWGKVVRDNHISSD